MDARPFEITHDSLRCLSFVQSLFKDRNAPIWRIGNWQVKGSGVLEFHHCIDCSTYCIWKGRRAYLFKFPVFFRTEMSFVTLFSPQSKSTIFLRKRDLWLVEMPKSVKKSCEWLIQIKTAILGLGWASWKTWHNFPHHICTSKAKLEAQPTC